MLLEVILLTLSRFLHTVYLQHMNELPNSDKLDKIFKEILLVTPKTEEKVQKLYFY